MKVVTVRQPFASLIAVGAKTLLDQTRPTGYRGRLLIRAAARRLPRGAEVAGGRVMAVTGGGACWLRPGYRWGKQGDEAPLMLPRGVVVASCELVDCVPTVEVGDQSVSGALLDICANDRLLLWRSALDPVDVSDQLPFGDFTPGRHVWLLDDVRPTTERCPRCWGVGCAPEDVPAPGRRWWCQPCNGSGACPPVRMRGGPGLRTPEWET